MTVSSSQTGWLRCQHEIHCSQELTILVQTLMSYSGRLEQRTSMVGPLVLRGHFRIDKSQFSSVQADTGFSPPAREESSDRILRRRTNSTVSDNREDVGRTLDLAKGLENETDKFFSVDTSGEIFTLAHDGIFVPLLNPSLYSYTTNTKKDLEEERRYSDGRPWESAHRIYSTGHLQQPCICTKRPSTLRP